MSRKKPPYQLLAGHATLSHDGLLFFLPDTEAEQFLELACQQGFHRSPGSLMSPSKDREMGEQDIIRTTEGYIEGWWFNPSLFWKIQGHNLKRTWS